MLLRSCRYLAVAYAIGLAIGVGAAGMGPNWRNPAVAIASGVGGLWLDALRMTVIPLLFALLFKGVVGGTRALSGGKLAARTLLWFLGLSFLSKLKRFEYANGRLVLEQ